jgi:hypothetical protein
MNIRDESDTLTYTQSLQSERQPCVLDVQVSVSAHSNVKSAAV